VTCKPTNTFILFLISVALLLLGGLKVFAADASDPAANDGGEKIYKKIGPGGEVIYSDRPSADSKEIKVPKGTEYKPVAPPAGFSPYKAPAKTKTQASIENSITITAPKNDAAFWSGNGEVTVSVSLGSALAPGQQLEYLIDGNSVFTGSETSHTFTNIYRGTHVVTVRITDSSGSSITSPPVTFHIHRPIQKPIHPPAKKPKP